MANQVSFGGATTSVNRFVLAGTFSLLTTYQPFSVVYDPASGASYVALTTTLGNAVSNATYWAQMTAAGGVTSVAGRSGTVLLASADLTDANAALGCPTLDGSGFLKPAQFNEGIDAIVATTYAIAASDRGRIKTFSNASPVAVSIAQATGSFAAGYFVTLQNIGAGLLTLTPSVSTCDGAATVTLKQWESITLTSSGGQYICLRSKVRASFADISGTVAAAQLPNPSASTLGGVESIAAVGSKWLNAISTSGVPSATQPAFTDISGTATSAQIPIAAAAARGGVFSKAAVTHQFLTSISSVDGSIGQAQPAAADLSDGVTGTGTVVLSSAPTVTHPVVATGISQGSGVKHQRFGTSCATAASAGSVCSSTLTWTSAFADANYTVSCVGSQAGGVPILTNSTKLAASISISVWAATAAAASFASVDCIAIHD